MTEATATDRRGVSARAVAITAAVALLLSLVMPSRVAFAAGPCGPPIVNAVACENTLTGNPASEWDVGGNGDSTIQGFATDISVNRGGTVSFKVSTTATAYRLDIYRMGYYGGAGARRVATIMPSASLPQTQPACLTVPATGLTDCGNWGVSASWNVPATAVSGIYFARPVRTDNNGASHMMFVVRDDAGTSDILFQTSDTTWQAYNYYGGNSLYRGSPAGRAYKVSYNRPFNNRGNVGAWVFDAEYPMVRWLESNGYDVSYFTGVDSDRFGSLIQRHRVFLSVGHDEYWSGAQRANVEAARGAGVSLGFFSGNEVFWKTRWESSVDGSNTAYRTLVSYKETHANQVIDPADPPVWTGTWRDPRFSPPADGGRPENALTGTIFQVNGSRADTVAVPSAEGKMRFWRNTSVATLGAGQVATLANGTLGNEWDIEVDNGFRPPGIVRLSLTTVTVSADYLQDYGSTYGPGTATHRMTEYRSGNALVFSAGAIHWSWGLDAMHDGAASVADVRMQQAMVNLLADMRAQPATLRPGLVAATVSTDTAAPASTISSPANGATLPAGTATVITGTAADMGGGIVGGVEVSTDGGTTWHPATGRESWTYSWTPMTPGATATIRSRAVDDSGNLEAPGAGVAVTIGACGSCQDSLALNGSSAYAEAPNATELNITGDWTLESWFKDESPAGYNHSVSYIAMKGDTNANGEAPYYLGVQWNTLFAGGRTAWNNSYVSASVSSLSANVWHHTAASFVASTRQLTLFIDGAQVAQGVLGARTTTGNTVPLDVGRNGTTGQFWQGKIDDLRVWNVARSATEISTSFRSELASAPASLVGNWKFNEATGAVAADSTAIPENATLFGSAGWSADVGNGPPPPPPPTAITGVSAGSVTNGSAVITWTTNNPASSQVAYGTTASYGGASTLDTALVTSHSQQLTGLTASTLYHYQVSSTDGGGTTVSSLDATFTTAAPPPPTTITGVSAGSLTNTTATITWTTNNPATSQVAYGLTSGYGGTTTVDNTLVTSHSQLVSGLTANTTYHYQVRSTDAGGTPVSSVDATFTTANTPPLNSLLLNGTNAWATAPNATELNITGNWTVESWFKDETPGGYNHDITYIAMKGDTNANGEAPYYLGVSWNTLFAGGRTGWTNYVVSASLASVSANAWHHAAASFVASTRTVTLYLDATQVAQGVLGAATASGNALGVEIGRQGSGAGMWRGKIDDVRIWNVTRTASEISTNFRSELTSAPATLVGNWKFNEGSGTVANDSGATPQNAVLSAGAAWSTDVGNLPPPPPGPTAITGVSAGSITNGSAIITWTTNNPASSQVAYGTTASYGSTTTLDSTLVTSHSQQLTGLAASTLYHYQVSSTDGLGSSASSVDATFTTAAPPPATTITGVTAGGLTNTTATISWTTNNAATSQVAYGPTAGYGTTTTLDGTLVTTHSQTISGLTPNTTYHYQARSTDAGGTPVASGDNTFTTTNAPAVNSLLLIGGAAEAPNATKLNITGDWTLEAWFKDENVSGFNHDITYIAMKGNTDSNGEAPYTIGVSWNTLFAGGRTGWTNYMVSASLGSVSASAWHHAAASFAASTRTVTLYLDGAQVAQGVLGARSTSGNSLPVEIGRNGSGAAAWRGKVDDFRIWNVVRTPTEISTNYRTELASAPASLVGNWQFNEGSGTTAADSTAAPQNATLLTGAGWSTDIHP